MILEFTVFGIAQPMGSKRAFIPKGWRRALITDSNKNLRTWQVLVSEAASAALREKFPYDGRSYVDKQILAGGVRLTLAVYLPRPKVLHKHDRPAHTKRPDLDKIVRAVCDALAKVVYHDDAQVVELIASKRYVGLGGIPHIDVRIEPTAGLADLGVVPIEYALRAP